MGVRSQFEMHTVDTHIGKMSVYYSPRYDIIYVFKLPDGNTLHFLSKWNIWLLNGLTLTI